VGALIKGSFAEGNINMLSCKIYELKGLVSSLVTITEHDDNMHHPIIETIENQMNQVLKLIEGGN
jgi:hypothetical protein